VDWMVSCRQFGRVHSGHLRNKGIVFLPVRTDRNAPSTVE
jgi:hypothetical protein